MSGIERRAFLGRLACNASALAVLRSSNLAQTTRAADSRIEVLLREPVATISPDIYGHFAEHLGGVIYDGIWVGEKSKVPNTGGIRTALVDAMKRIKPGVIRYPGGCFADSYDWRDGTGARATRPRRTNFWVDDREMGGPALSAQRFEPNLFGTNEFVRFCQLTGAQAYLAANLRGLSAQDFYEWVEYCNAPAGSTTWTDVRAKGEMGSREPFGVRYWGVGNESWGCGGNFTPDEYASEFRRFTAAVPRYGVDLKFIASGPNDGDLNWTRGFFAKTLEKGADVFGGIYGWALHHYSWNTSSGKTNDWVEGKGDAINFSAEQYYELLREGDRIENLINQHWTVMGEYDRQRRVKLIVDEWGAWYRGGTQVAPTHLLGQQSTMRDAVLAGLNLDTFNRHADKVVMANVAQLINCLQSLFLATEDKFVLTPTYHVFDMYAAHQGAQSLRAEFISPKADYTRAGQSAGFWGLNGSASLKGKELTLTVVAPDADAPRETEINIGGASVAACRARVLAAPDIHAHNSFENPRALEPKDEQVNVANGGRLTYSFAPASVTRLQITLA